MALLSQVGTRAVAAPGKLKKASAVERRGSHPPADPRTGLLLPPLVALRNASARGDRVEIGRLAERFGPARLQELLRDRDPATVAAALDATTALEGNIRLLPAVTRVLTAGDAKLRLKAAGTIGTLLRADLLDKAFEWEIPRSEISAACGALAQMADVTAAPVATRVAALEALAEAYAFCRINIPLGTLSEDVWPEVRRAALLTPQIVRVRSIAAIGEMSEDQVPMVASAAAATWCQHRLGSLQSEGLLGDAKARLRRMRVLVLMDAVPSEDTAEMLPCLALSKDPEDKRAFEVARGRVTGGPRPAADPGPKR